MSTTGSSVYSAMYFIQMTSRRCSWNSVPEVVKVWMRINRQSQSQKYKVIVIWKSTQSSDILSVIPAGFVCPIQSLLLIYSKSLLDLLDMLSDQVVKVLRRILQNSFQHMNHAISRLGSFPHGHPYLITSKPDYCNVLNMGLPLKIS